MTWIQTMDGGKFDLLNPQPSMIDVTTLATCLARKCRFGGHCLKFYSVAQHSILVSELVDDVPGLRLAALLHDAHEAYSGFGDVLRPAKQLNKEVTSFIDSVQHRIDSAIALKFGVTVPFNDARIKHADNVALATEARDLMAEPPCPWDQLPPPANFNIRAEDIKTAAMEFMIRLRTLTP